MARKINNIKVLKNTVYIDFDDGTFGTHSFYEGKWCDKGITADELSAARKLAIKDGKWTNWKAPRKINPQVVVARAMEEEEADMEAQEQVRRDDAQRNRNQHERFDSMFDSMYGIEG